MYKSHPGAWSCTIVANCYKQTCLVLLTISHGWEKWFTFIYFEGGGICASWRVYMYININMTGNFHKSCFTNLSARMSRYLRLLCHSDVSDASWGWPCDSPPPKAGLGPNMFSTNKHAPSHHQGCHACKSQKAWVKVTMKKKACVNLFSVLYILGIWLSSCHVCLDLEVWRVLNAIGLGLISQMLQNTVTDLA